VYGEDTKGVWQLLTDRTVVTPHEPRDLRLEATLALRKSGYRFVLVPTGAGGNAPLGNVIVGHEAEWGMEQAGYAGDYYLLRVK